MVAPDRLQVPEKEVDCPATTVTAGDGTVHGLPPTRMETTLTELEPLLVRVTVYEPSTAERPTELTLTRAVLVNDPNRPKTKPAIPIAAINVIAIRMTVARTGLIPFLPDEILKLLGLYPRLFAFMRFGDSIQFGQKLRPCFKFALEITKTGAKVPLQAVSEFWIRQLA